MRSRLYDLSHPLPNEKHQQLTVVAYEPFHPRAEELRAANQLLMRWSKGSARMLERVPVPRRAQLCGRQPRRSVFQLGERTLLIDADLRAPRQHRIFNVPDRVGLTAVLSGRADRGAVASVREFGRLSLLPAGAPPPNPQELLSRPALGALLQEMWSEFDIILFDTPPAKFYADAQNVAFRAGSAVMLTRKDHTRLADTTSVIRELSDAGVRVVGTVFNAF